MRQLRFNVKHFIILSGYLFSVGWSCVLLATFFRAYFNDSFSVLVTVNSIGEANVDLFVMVPIFGIMLLGLIYLLFEGKKKRALRC